MRTFVDLSAVTPHLEAGRRMLTPGLRLARQLTDQWVRQSLESHQVVMEPTIEPIDAWLEAQWLVAVERGQLAPQRLMSKLEERLLWQSIVETENSHSGDFRLLQPSAAAEQARVCRDRLMHYAPTEDDLRSRGLFQSDADCRAFAAWCQQFDARLRAQGWATRADAYRQLLSLTVNDRQPLVLCHCLQLTPLTLRALSHLGDIHTVGDDPSPDHASQSPAKPWTPLAIGQYEDRDHELASVARWAAARHRQGKETTGIVLMDIKNDRPVLEYFLRQEFDCLDARYNSLPVNFSTGMPLGQTPMFRDALLALSLDFNPLTRQRISQLIRSPYAMGINFAESPGGLRLASSIAEMLIDPIGVDDFQHLIHRCAPESNVAKVIAGWRIDKERHSKQDLPSWCAYIRRQLALWGWPNRAALDSVEYQQLDRFERSLDSLAGLATDESRMSYRRAIGLWSQCLDDLIFQPKTQSGDLQVMGSLEAVGLGFDALWVCGLQAGVLPTRPRLLPFIPGSLQRDWSLPNADAQRLASEARALISSWRASHGMLKGSYRRTSDGVEQQASPLVSIDSIYPDASAQRPSHWCDVIPLEAVDDRIAPPLIEAQMVAYGGGASVLKNQSACPFRAWVTHRLGPHSPASPRLGLTPAERGSIVHDALYYLWGQLGDAQALSTASSQALMALVTDGITFALQKLERASRSSGIAIRKRVGSACLDIEAERCQLLLMDWLERERERSEDFTVIERERDHELSVGPLLLTLRPDRVDQLSDGRRVVLDYKTGSGKVSSWLGDRPAEPQLPLYVLLDHRVAGLSFAQLRREETQFVCLGEGLGLKSGDKGLTAQLKKSRAEVLSWEDLTSAWRANLTVLAEQYARGEAQIDPLPQACDYCDFASVCRINDNSSGVSV